jgi:acetyl esterase/lipase
VSCARIRVQSSVRDPRVSPAVLVHTKLRQAGVPVTAVRYQGIIHDFVMLNARRETHAAEAAITQASGVLRTALGIDA